MIEQEIWKDIKGYDGKYKVSSLGNIKSFTYKSKGKLLKPQEGRKGYLQVLLYKNNKAHPKKVHRLVAEAFLGNFCKKPQVNHIDGNKKNNNVSNLEMVTNSENQIHAYKNKLETPRKSRKAIQKNTDGVIIKIWMTIREAANHYGIDETYFLFVIFI